MAQQHTQKRISSAMPSSTPMTMPAIAPPDRPLFVLTVMPVTALPSEATGVWKGTVVVAVPVEVMVRMVLLVGRTKPVAEAEEGVTGMIPGVPAPGVVPPMAAHWPENWQNWPWAQQMGPQETWLSATLQMGFEEAGVVVTAKVWMVGDAAIKEL